MTFVNYIGADHEDIRRAELIFQSDEWSHILVLGTDTVAIVPNEDIAPCQGVIHKIESYPQGARAAQLFCVFMKIVAFSLN